MRVVAAIFIVAGMAYLALDFAFAIDGGINPGNLFMALFSSILLYQGYALFQSKKGARWGALFIAAVIALSCTSMASFFLTPFPESFSSIPATAWPTLGALLVVAATFAVAALILVFSKPREPN